MAVFQVLALLLVLCDGRPGLSRAQTQVYTAAEGGNITVRCLFYSSGKNKIFCKNNCTKTDILVETLAYRHQNGRYSIRYEEKFSDANKIYVDITNVSRSDSGPYRCGLETWTGDRRTQVLSTFSDFVIEVTTAATFTNSTSPTIGPFYNVTTTQQTVSSPQTDSSSETTSPSEHQQHPTTTAYGGLWFVDLTLTIVLILLSVTLFKLCRKYRAKKPKEPSEASECALPETEDAADEVVYSDLNFTKSSAPRRQTEAEVSAAPQVHTEDVLYSTVASPKHCTE